MGGLSIPEISSVITAICSLFLIPAVKFLWSIDRRVLLLEVNAGIKK